MSDKHKLTTVPAELTPAQARSLARVAADHRAGLEGGEGEVLWHLPIGGAVAVCNSLVELGLLTTEMVSDENDKHRRRGYALTQLGEDYALAIGLRIASVDTEIECLEQLLAEMPAEYLASKYGDVYRARLVELLAEWARAQGVGGGEGSGDR